MVLKRQLSPEKMMGTYTVWKVLKMSDLNKLVRVNRTFRKNGQKMPGQPYGSVENTKNIVVRS